MSGSGQPRLTAALRLADRTLYRIPSDLPLPWPFKRRWTELVATANAAPRGLTRTRGRIAGVQAERLAPSGDGDGALLYLHGGGYVQGSPRVQRVAASHLALASGVPAYSPDYRLAPEHPFPAAFDDAFAAYLSLVDRYGAGRVAVAGDSAGGGLALAVALAARDEGTPPPALFLICPWVDLVAGHTRGPDSDPILSRAFLRAGADAYLGERDRADPRCSPVYGELAGLPPTLVHTAAEDPLLPDSVELAARARAAGVELELDEFPLWHDFHLHAALLAISREALERGGRFIARRLG